MRIVVFVERWQHECCGAEFTVGEQVEWRLAVDAGWRAAQLGTGAPTRVIDLPVARVLRPDGPEPAGLLLARDGLHAFLSSRDATPGLEPTGASTRPVVLFEEDHHGGVPQGVPPTSGVVEAIRLARCTFVLDPADRVNKPLPGSSTLSRTDRAARWHADTAAGQRFTGFLVDLRVVPQTDGPEHVVRW